MVLQMLGEMEVLLSLLESQGAVPEARRMAREIHGFFEGHARQHHADEERSVFPGLLASNDESLRHHVLRLQQDHGWLEEDWRVLAPQLEAVAQGYNWFELPMLRLALPVFRELYEEHIALEESLIYPAAMRREAALAEGARAREALKPA
ncbi:MAG: hemerythrin domain-containing protein [Burkholderiales bacterium]|nr:hemerythrin domain-containing protein [Burkholderiales bacterium]